MTVYNGTCGTNLTWTLDTSTGVLAINGTGAMYGYSNNSSYMHDSRPPWFSHQSSLTAATIADGVTTIGSYAFYGCTGLTSVTIPNSVTAIDSYAFYGCTGLTSVTIPNSVTAIGGNVFLLCTSLTAISVADGNTAYSSADGVLYNADKTTLIVCPTVYSGTTVTIPSSVTAIDPNAFYGCAGLDVVTFRGDQPSLGVSSFILGTSSKPVTATIKSSGWASDSVFNTIVRGSYTTFTYIGLSPTIPVNISGTWKDSTPYVNVNGTWKAVSSAYVNINGVWTEL